MAGRIRSARRGHACHGQRLERQRDGELTLTPTSHVAILGFGARARAFAALLAPRGCALRAWDPLLATGDADQQRVRIEAAGVDACGNMSVALRGARLVVLDSVPASALPAGLAAGQELLDLASAPAAHIDAVLGALGLPHASGSWLSALAQSTTSAQDSSAVRRGELP
jgi:hypothetical protein